MVETGVLEVEGSDQLTGGGVAIYTLGTLGYFRAAKVFISERSVVSW